MEVLKGPRDRRARESRHPGDKGNPSSPQLLSIDGSNQVLLSLSQLGEQGSVFLLKLFFFAHAGGITWTVSFITANNLPDLTRY